MRNPEALRAALDERERNQPKQNMPETLQCGSCVAVRWIDNAPTDGLPAGWRHKIVKVKTVLEDGIIDLEDKVWRKYENKKGCIHGHATMRPASWMEALCNQVEWEIREIHWV